MKKSIFILVLFFAWHSLLASPPDTLRLDSIYSIKGASSCVTIDAFKNLFWTQANGTLEQYDSLGRKKQYLYSNNRLGAPDFIDASNPLKTVLFYKNYQRLVLLDRTLTEAGLLDFNETGFGWISTVCLAQDGSLWIYDQVDFSLKNISQQGKVRYQGQSLNNLLTQPVLLQKLYVHTGRVYAWNDAHLYIFDNFGQYIKHIPLKGLRSIKASKIGFLCVFQDEIVQFDPFFLEIKTWKMIAPNPNSQLPTFDDKTNVFLVQRRIIHQERKALTVYSW